LPFALLYLLDEDRPCASLLAKTGLDDSFASATIRLDHNDPWGVARVIREGNIQSALARFGEKPYQSDGVIVLNDLALHFGNLPGGVWPEPTTSAIVLPIAKPGQNGGTAGVLVAGINPRRALDDTYRGFFDLVAGHLATAVSNARAYEEERKRTEALAEIDRAKTQFFSNVSHEFRTPLTLMLGPLEDVLAKPETSRLSEHRSLLRLAHRNGVRLLKLVNTLLDFSRIEAGRVQVSFEPVDLAIFTAELASNFHSAIEKAGLRLVVDCPSLPQPVYVDIDMWEKVVLNLISNAFKFTFEGEIAIVTRPSSDGSCAEVTIRDSGTGISPEELPHLFERFHRVEGARGRSIEGSGIGLALVQELVKLHGGSIRVASQVEQGSAFTVASPFGTAHLPAEQISRARTQATTNVRAQAYVEEALGWLSDGAATGASEPPPPSTPQDPGDVAAVAGAEDPLILVADDNVDMRNYVQRILRAGGFRVEAVTDGKKALAAAGRLKPDLVLSDVMMPELDGFELLTAFRKDPELRDTPVLLLSARAGEEAKVEGLLAGADDYLIKPFSTRELLARVGVKLQLARNRRERAEVLQAELARVTRLTTMGEMTASIAHEVNQPLMAIVTNADSCLSWLASDTPQIDEARMAAERIVRDGHRAGDIIKSIRALARKSRLEMTQLDMNDALAEVLALTRGELRRHDISLETELSGGFAPVMADRIQVQQVVLNLVMNGIEAMKAIMDRPRVLRVGSQIDGSGSVLIAVADTGTGTGLDPAKADRIFDAFFTTKPDGIGMGLSICRSIIEAHGGRIWASSNPPYGSVFQFSMPGITKGVSSDRLG
jgi:signal transduction histidine kinase